MNKAGQAVAAYWVVNTRAVISAVPYDGNAWGTLGTITEPAGGGSNAPFDDPQYAVLSNGDAVFLFVQDNLVQTSLFHAPASTFDPPVTVPAQPAVYSVYSFMHARHVSLPTRWTG
jgi:hypothetical protein